MSFKYHYVPQLDAAVTQTVQQHKHVSIEIVSTRANKYNAGKMLFVDPITVIKEDVIA